MQRQTAIQVLIFLTSSTLMVLTAVGFPSLYGIVMSMTVAQYKVSVVIYLSIGLVLTQLRYFYFLKTEQFLYGIKSCSHGKDYCMLMIITMAENMVIMCMWLPIYTVKGVTKLFDTLHKLQRY